MADHDMSLPDILRQQLEVLCGADRSILDTELELFSLRERRMNNEEDDSYIMPFQDFSVRPPPCAQRRKAA